VRTRAVLAAVAALVPVLTVATAAGVLVQRNDLTNSTVLVAREHADAVVRELDAGTEPQVALAAAGGEDLVQVIAGGTVLAASDDMESDQPLAPPSADTTTTSGLVPGEEDRYVVVTSGTETAGQYVALARSLEAVDEATSSTTRLLVVGSLLVVTAVCALTWILTGRALRPVESMRRRAEQITAADLSARLPTPTTGDEVARLATTMNALLDRIEDAVAVQRQFVADASHELRSPVAAIRALHETAHLGGPGLSPAPWSDDDALSAEVLGEVARLEALVSDLLLLARDEQRPGTAVPVDLAAEVMTLTARPRRVRIAVNAPEPAWVLGDPQALARMIHNLLDNAVRHASAVVEVTVEMDGDSVLLIVADDGPGIPEHDRERVFGRFVRLDEARARDAGGSGLGLAIVRQIATRHGGTARAEATPTPDRGADLGGAMFVVTLPAHQID